MEDKELKRLNSNLEKINYMLEKNKILELSELLDNKKKLFVRNLISGIFKGIGIGIGFSLLTAVLVYILQKIVKLNIPIISEYIIDIIEIVKRAK